MSRECRSISLFCSHISLTEGNLNGPHHRRCHRDGPEKDKKIKEGEKKVKESNA